VAHNLAACSPDYDGDNNPSKSLFFTYIVSMAGDSKISISSDLAKPKSSKCGIVIHELSREVEYNGRKVNMQGKPLSVLSCVSQELETSDCVSLRKVWSQVWPQKEYVDKTMRSNIARVEAALGAFGILLPIRHQSVSISYPNRASAN
jgi:hypothetical protein